MIESNPETHFDAALFDAELAAHGINVGWRRALTCPCIDPQTGQPDANHAKCDNGIVWAASETVRILAPGRNRRDNYDVTGLWMQGIITLTFPSAFVPGHLDRIDMLEAEMAVTSDVMTRGQAIERLRIRPVLGVDLVQAFVAGDLVDVTEDVTADEDTGELVFDPDPGSGVRYSVRYRTRPAYVVWSPQSRDENGAKMPYRALAQRLDFFRRSSVGG